MEPEISEALRYLGARDAPEELRRKVAETARELAQAVKPTYTFRVFPLCREQDTFSVVGTQVRLCGHSADAMLGSCGQVALLACTLGVGFDNMLRARQARSMSAAVILDACGSAYVEAGCDGAEAELRGLLPGKYLTDRFSPGYGDLSLEIQPELCGALDTRRRLGLFVTESLLLNPSKSVTAVIGVSDTPQPARIRGCAYCALKNGCWLRKGGKSCVV